MRKSLNTLLQAGVLSLALAFAVESAGADRVLRAHDFTVARGQTNTLRISLESLGTENALGFTVCFDTNLFALVPPVRRGVAISNLYPSATFTPNTAALETNGWIGVVIGLDIGSGETWPAGTNQLVEMDFRALPGTGSSNAVFSLCDEITTREVSDDTPQSLPADYINANVLVTGDCSYALNTNSTSVAFTGGSGSVNVLTDFICTWTAENTNAWIEITSATNGVGAGSVTFNVALNPALTPRSGSLTVAGQTFTVNQAAFVCDYAITPANRAHGPGAETNSVSLTTSNQCAWTIENTNSWITIISPASGTGSATVDYRLTANPNILARTGTVLIAGQTLTLVQDPLICTYALAPVSRNHAFTAVTNSFSVTAPAPCAWTASTTNNWIVLLSGTSGLGNGSVNYRLLANTSSAPRAGSIEVNGESFAVTQDGAPCDPVLAPSGLSHPASGGTTGLVSVTLPTGCAWNATTTNSWITIDSGTSGLGNGTVGYTVASNSQFTVRLGVITIAGADFTVSQAGAPCPTTLDPVSATVGHNASTGTVSVAVAGPCAWTTENTNAWVQILSGSGTSTGSVTYAVAPNTNITARAATLIIAGEVFTLTQNGAPCAYALAPANQNLGPNAVTNSFAVTAQAGCTWTVDNTNSWITIQSGPSGSGNGTVTYVLTANPVAVSRTGTILVADQSFEITQDAAACTFSISPTSRTQGPNAVTNTVILTTITGCSWTISNLNSWITFPAGTNGLDTTTNTYEVATNPDPVSRTGLVMIGGRLLTIVQNPAPCSYVLDPTGFAHGSGSETGLLSVATHALCAWTANTTDGWITINSGASGTGPGSIGYTIAANTNGAARTGHITVSGQTFTITQAGLPCVFALTPTNASHGFHTVTASVAVATLEGCNWMVSNTNSWIFILSSLNNSGSNIVSYALPTNPSTLPRAGVIVIAGIEFPVAQAGAPCTYALVPASRTHASGTSSDSLIVEAGLNCNWTVSSTNLWLSITSATNGAGTNTISYSVAANPNPAQRVGALVVEGQTFIVTQLALVCEITIAPANRTHGSGVDTNTISITANGAGCVWNAATAAGWITLSGASGSGDGAVTYTLAANPNGTNRTGSVQITDKIFTITQDAAPCLFTVAPLSVTNTPAAFTNTFTVTTLNGCVWTSTNTNSWITLTSPASRTNSGSVTAVVAANPTSIARTGVVEIAGQLVTVIQNGLPCVFALSSNSRNHTRDAVTNSVELATPIGCAWSVSTAQGWITILSPLNNTGSNTVSYELSENFDIISRTGTVQIADQTLTLIQAGTPCVYALTPTNAAPGANGATNTVALTTATNCAWAVVNTNSWITFTSPTSGLGSANLEYIVAANPSIIGRAGVVVIAGETFAVTQAGETCAYLVAPLSRSHSASSVTNSIGVTTQAGCVWSVSNGVPWISIVASLTRTNSGAVTYVLAANESLSSRSAVVLVAGQSVTLTQDGIICSYALTPTNRQHSFVATTNTFAVSAQAACAWDVSTTNAWISLLSPTNATGTGTVTYALLANPVITARTGSVLVADQVFTVVQDAAPCVYSLAPSVRTHGVAGTNGTVALTVLAGCAWEVVNTNSWITIDSPTNGTGSAVIAYTVDQNFTVFERTGVVVIGGELFTVTQNGELCDYEVTPLARDHGAEVATNSFAVTTLVSCPWAVVNSNAWINFTSGLSYSNSGAAAYVLAPNPSYLSRTGTVLIAGQPVTVTQQGVPCFYAITPAQRTHAYVATTNSVAVTPTADCPWTATTADGWITILAPLSGNGTGVVSYALAENPVQIARTGTVTIASQTLTLIQDAAPCTYSFAPTNRTHDFLGATGSVALTTFAPCAWTVLNTNGWISILSATNGLGSTNVDYAVAENPFSVGRTGRVEIAGQIFTVQQLARPCVYVLSATNAAHGSLADSGAFNVATSNDCAWAASTSTSWITLTPPTNGLGNGVVNYTVAANPVALPRAGTILVSGQTFSVTQAAAPCVYGLTPAQQNFTANAATGAVSVATLADCPWTATTTNTWLTILAATTNSGNGSVNYAVAENLLLTERVGFISIANQTLVVTQQAVVCTYALTPSNRAHGFGSETGLVSMATSLNCPWSAVATNSWIALTVPGGVGTGTVGYTLEANPTSLPRSGVVMIGGQPFTISQAGAGCVFTLGASGVTQGAGAITGAVTVTTLVGCVWNVTNTTPWITLLPPLNHTNSGSFDYALLANPTSLTRTGVLTVANQTFTITQSGAACTFALATNSALHVSDLSTNSVVLTTLVGCAWSVVNTNPWIEILSGLNRTNRPRPLA